MPEPKYQSLTDTRSFNLEASKPEIDLGAIPSKTEPKKIEESKGIFCRFSTNLKQAVVYVSTAIIIAFSIPTAQAAELPRDEIPSLVEDENSKSRERPFETATAEADTYECSLTNVKLIYYSMEEPPETTYYEDIPFAYQDSSGTLIDQYAFEDTTGSYPSFFADTIASVNPVGTPGFYEILFRYRHKNLSEIETEMDSINTSHGGGVTMEITINDSTSIEWLRVTNVKWDDQDTITGELFFPRCRGPPEYYWVDITPENPSRTFDDDFLILDVPFAWGGVNPTGSRFRFYVNLNYTRDLVSSVGISENQNKEEIKGALRPYPNPTNNSFSLALDNKYENADVKIYDNNGRLIKEINGFSQGQSIDLREYVNPTGIYLISVFDSNTDELIGKTKVTYMK
ncbi:T9SS type A sorting domain-containing protein [Candidatus Micrarchaeota archaeon]|nr:T9SS type A sorting domain-containing protein [Candidatus Micrarchaeota archaeon]